MNHNGIGLGLSIVKQIVKQSGGNISVYSDGPGLGSLFCFSMKMDHFQEYENEEEVPLDCQQAISSSLTLGPDNYNRLSDEAASRAM